MESSEDFVDVNGPHAKDEECPLCKGTICPTLVDEILKAAENVAPPMSAKKFSQWLKSEFPNSGD